MSLIDGMKDKLGFKNNNQNWEDQEEYYDEGEEYYDDGNYDDNGGDSASDGRHEVVSFDAYNPDNFEHVTLASDHKPRVAPIDGYDSTRPSSGPIFTGSRSSGASYSRNIGTSARRSSYSSSPSDSRSWGAVPDDPSFLDSSRLSRDPYSNLGSDFLGMNDDPAMRLEIVRPKIYADVEKIANAAKAGKSVVLDVADTKPALAKRILDFSFGVASALNQNVDKAADRVFVISKGSKMLNEEERKFLVKKGVLKS